MKIKLLFVYALIFSLAGCYPIPTPEQYCQNDDRIMASRAAQKGDASAQHSLGLMYEYGPDDCKNYQKAIEWFEKADQKGYAPAQYSLGYMYDEGKGVTQDYQKAKELYEKAAQQGSNLALYSLGKMYENGKGVTQDYQKAKEWAGKACDNGSKYGYEEGCNLYKKLNEDGH